MTTDSTAGSINQKRLFLGSCLALIATATAFAVVGAIMNSLKAEFVLTNAEVGWIAGAALWGFTVSMVVFGPFVDVIGMKRLMWLACLGHVAGVLIMVFATGFTMLFIGALVIAMGNGLVEAVCNPLVAALYPDNKTVKLNHFHVWFPGGIVLGGLGAYVLAQVGITQWELTLSLILIPAVIYAFLFMGQEFPETERVAKQISTADMWKACITPFFLLMLLCMMMTASLELGPNRWVPAVLEAGGIAGILVLVYINGLMAVLRFRAGDLVHRLQPTGILLASAILAGLGLLWLSYAETTVMAFAAATVFAIGVCYFWPTMLGVVAERNVAGGALALALMGGAGMAAVGLITSPLMGDIADGYAHERFEMQSQETIQVLQQARDTFPTLAQAAEGEQGQDILSALEQVNSVLSAQESAGSLPEIETANALRAIINSGGDAPVVGQANAILGPADNYGGRLSFRWVAPLSIFLAIVFGILYAKDRKGTTPHVPEPEEAPSMA